MTQPIGIAIVGAGAIANAYEAAIGGLDGARITAVCDVRRDNAAALASRTGSEFFTSVDELAECGRFDVAVVCTPPSSHEEVSRTLLARGAHVLCEKPLATEPLAARRMLEAARKAGRLLTMASKFRFAHDVREAHRIVRNGGIGELVFVENAFTGRVDMRSRWNADPRVSGGGVLIDNGTHAVDLLRYFLGPLFDIQVIEGKRFQELAVEDTVRLFVHNGDGAMGTSDLSWSIDKHLGSFLRLYGSEGTIVVGWKESRCFTNTSGEWRTIGSGYDKVDAFREQLRNFLQAMNGEAELTVTPLDALASVDVINAAYRAMDRAAWQPIAQATSTPEFEPALQVS